MLTRIEKVCGAPTVQVLRRISDAANAMGVSTYLVGGMLRDALLGIPSFDLDIMVEGDAPAFAKFLHAEWAERFPDDPLPKKPSIYKHYGTAKLRFSEPLVGDMCGIDFSSARTERYPVPGGKPEISAGDIRSDLQRRDFSVNALAMRLTGCPSTGSPSTGSPSTGSPSTGSPSGELIDLFDGQADLTVGQIRVLHEKSFLDDPARLIRAMRFCVRFKFVLEAVTQKLFFEAIENEYLKTLPTQRLAEEFRKGCDEPTGDVLRVRLAECGMLEQIESLL